MGRAPSSRGLPRRRPAWATGVVPTLAGLGTAARRRRQLAGAAAPRGHPLARG
ncbi:MAG: PTPA-CTERM sorting domain-containing protein [Propionibacteriaceae bacterium]|nr:PTPA-CTERM sorting domain-containing protein [Propionibacteriaceae bacterium]